jgi:hypothetical protein
MYSSEPNYSTEEEKEPNCDVWEVCPVGESERNCWVGALGDVNGSRDGEQLASSGDLNARAGLLPSAHRLGTARVTSLLYTGSTSSVTSLRWYKL